MTLGYTSGKVSIIIGLTALNLAVGGIVSFFKLPIYLDSIGLVVSTILLGWMWGLACAVLTVLAGALIVNPYLPFYIVTAAAIVVTVEVLRRFNLFSSLPRAVVSGICIAVVAAIISAPVTTYLFSGITLSGVDALTAYFAATGQTLLEAVLFSGFASEPVDKVIVSVVAYYTLLGLPPSVLSQYEFRAVKD